MGIQPSIGTQACHLLLIAVPSNRLRLHGLVKTSSTPAPGEGVPAWLSVS